MEVGVSSVGDQTVEMVQVVVDCVRPLEVTASFQSIDRIRLGIDGEE